MKKSKIFSLFLMLIFLSSCNNKTEDSRNNIESSNIKINESSDNKDIVLEAYPQFESEGQFKLKVIDASIRKYHELEDENILENLKDEDKDKYIVFIDYIFEDCTIDSDINFSSYNLEDILPNKAESLDGNELSLVSATNIVDTIKNHNQNEQSVRAVYVVDKKVSEFDLSFAITNKLGEKVEKTLNIKVEETSDEKIWSFLVQL